MFWWNSITKMEEDRKGATSNGGINLPNLPAFVEGEYIYSYLIRFERYAKIAKWDKSVWPINLSILLTGKALKVYAQLSDEDASDWDKLKIALQNGLNQETSDSEEFRTENESDIECEESESEDEYYDAEDRENFETVPPAPTHVNVQDSKFVKGSLNINPRDVNTVHNDNRSIDDRKSLVQNQTHMVNAQRSVDVKAQTKRSGKTKKKTKTQAKHKKSLKGGKKNSGKKVSSRSAKSPNYKQNLAEKMVRRSQNKNNLNQRKRSSKATQSGGQTNSVQNKLKRSSKTAASSMTEVKPTTASFAQNYEVLSPRPHAAKSNASMKLNFIKVAKLKKAPKTSSGAQKLPKSLSVKARLKKSGQVKTSARKTTAINPAKRMSKYATRSTMNKIPKQPPKCSVKKLTKPTPSVYPVQRRRPPAAQRPRAPKITAKRAQTSGTRGRRR